jgi:hypothetical protein
MIDAWGKLEINHKMLTLSGRCALAGQMECKPAGVLLVHGNAGCWLEIHAHTKRMGALTTQIRSIAVYYMCLLLSINSNTNSLLVPI